MYGLGCVFVVFVVDGGGVALGGGTAEELDE